MKKLTSENYSKGFLIDEDLMAGVTANSQADTSVKTPAVASVLAPEKSLEGAPEKTDDLQSFSAYVLRHTTGEYLGFQNFPTLEEALFRINSIPRDWVYESSSGCGACGEGNCSKETGAGCRLKINNRNVESGSTGRASDECCG